MCFPHPAQVGLRQVLQVSSQHIAALMVMSFDGYYDESDDQCFLERCGCDLFV